MGSLFIPQDVNHKISAAWIAKFVNIGGLLIVPTFVLLEIAASIARQQGTKTEAKQIVIDLEESNEVQFISLNSLLMRTAIDIAINQQLRAGDAIYVAVAYQHGIPLVSLDKEQLHKASSIVQTFSPDTYPF